MAFYFRIHQGTDFTVHFLCRNRGKKVDLTGYSAHMQIRKSLNSDVIDDLTEEDGRLVIDGDKIRAVFPNDVTYFYPTGELVYDVLVRDESGYTFKVLDGKIRVTGGVTR